MNSSTKTILTIITESSLEKKLCNDIEALGAGGYTITDARGKGEWGARAASWEYEGNIRIEVICSDVTGDAIKQHLQDNYYDDFAMIIYSHDVEVMRSSKFS